jgi:hypothetical protein
MCRHQGCIEPKTKEKEKNKKMPPRSNQRLATTRMPKVTTLKL